MRREHNFKKQAAAAAVLIYIFACNILKHVPPGGGVGWEGSSFMSHQREERDLERGERFGSTGIVLGG
jgi:hypothetical protein